MRVIRNAEVTEVKGEKTVEGLTYLDKKTNRISDLTVQGVFVEIGSAPSTDFINNLIELNKWNQIVVDPKNQRTTLTGIWAAGDATDGLYHQNNIAAGDAVKALEDIYLYLNTGKK